MDTQKLRQRILDLAIRGKLVPQDPNDEPASVLLDRIRAEKERLIAEGKIKRPKAKKSTDKSHYQNFTPPFDIPDSWEWVRLMDCCHIAGRIGFRGYTKDDLVSKDAGAITLSPSNIVNGSMQYDLCTYISWHKYYESPEIQVWEKDILLVKTGSSYGKCALVERLPKEATINPQYVVLKHVAISPEYLTYVLQSNYAKECYEQFVLGTAIPTFTQEKLGNLAIPLPPLYEQVRIVKTIKKYLNLIGILDSEVQSLSNEISHAKSKILDLAMQGKLVPQDPADEPATDMLRRINPNAKIITDNPHYPQLPDNWVLTKLGDVVKVINGKSQKEVENPSGAYPIYGSGGVIGKADAYSCLSGSTIIGRKGTINNPQFIETNFWNVDTAFGMKPYEAVNDLYFYYFCKSFDFTSLDKSSTLPSLTKTAIEGILMPTPPLGEQRRIILKIKEYDELFRNIFTQIGQK